MGCLVRMGLWVYSLEHKVSFICINLFYFINLEWVGTVHGRSHLLTASLIAVPLQKFYNHFYVMSITLLLLTDENPQCSQLCVSDIEQMRRRAEVLLRGLENLD